MKDSRKGKTDGEKELLTPNPHVDGGKSERAIVYNTKKEKKNGKGRMVDSQVITLNHIRGYLLCLYKHIILSF